MRKRWSLFGVAGALATALIAGAASGSPSSTGKAAAVSTAWLPPGVSPGGASWPASGGDSAGSGYSTLTQINPSNVSQLKVAWQLPALNLPGQDAYYKNENLPLILTEGQNGVGADALPMKTTMFMQTNYGLVALDPTNGNILWKFDGAPSCAPVNPSQACSFLSIGSHSIAYGDGMIFGGQKDGSLTAVNAKTGAAVWSVDTEAAGTNAEGGVFGESNPWAIFEPATPTNGLKQDLVFSAPNGGESPLRGHFDAYDAKTGMLVWRSWNTPDPTQLPFILSYGNPAEAAVAGVATWSVPVVDDTLGTVYFGTGNHVPETGGSPGKLYFSDSIKAVSLQTGQLRWFFQTVHHDEWDFDVANPPIRINPLIDGKRVPVVAIGGKDGYLDVLNAVNGGTVPHFGIPEVPIPDRSGSGLSLYQIWPTQPEPSGAAGQIVMHTGDPTIAQQVLVGFPTAPDGLPFVMSPPYAPPAPDAYIVWGPTAGGGMLWTRSAYNPATNDLYVCGNNQVRAVKGNSLTNITQTSLSGSPTQNIPGGSITAINMGTNTIDWQIKIPPSNAVPGGPNVRNGNCFSGIVTTASGLVFSAQNDAILGDGVPNIIPAVLYAYDAKTGKELWNWTNNEGSVMHSGVTPYMANGKEYIAIMANSPFPGPPGPGVPGTDHLTVFSLP
jgi:quinoprotein glucose dehydrogenase